MSEDRKGSFDTLSSESSESDRKAKSSPAWGWVVASIILLVVSAIAALLQGPPRDPYRPRSWFSAFVTPTESNAFNRLLGLSGRLADITVVPGTDEIWAVGDSGLVLQSPDGGATWRRIELPDALAGTAAGGGKGGAFPGGRPGGGPPSESGPDTRQRGDPADGDDEMKGPPKKSSSRGGAGAGIHSSLVRASGFPLALVGAVPGPEEEGRKRPFREEDEGAKKRPSQEQEEGASEPPEQAQGPPPDGLPFHLIRIEFVDHRFGWILGERHWLKVHGAVIYSTGDGGATWTPHLSPQLFVPRGMDLVTETEGWVIGESDEALDEGTLLFKVGEGGANWENRTPQGIPNRAPEDTSASYPMTVQFLDSNVGWVATRLGGILKTTNGGESWEPLPGGVPTGDRDIPSPGRVQFVDEQVGWAFDPGIAAPGPHVFQTTDGGDSWTPRSLRGDGDAKVQGGVPFDLHFIDRMRGAAIVREGTAFHLLETFDGGEHWALRVSRTRGDGWGRKAATRWTDTELSLAGGKGGHWITAGDAIYSFTGEPESEVWSRPLRPAFISYDFVDRLHGWAGASEGMVFATGDGGATWDAQDSGLTEDIAAVFFVNPSVGWAAGGRQIVGTRNGGGTWRLLHEDPELEFAELFFADELRGWTLGRLPQSGKGLLLSTTDGGRSWEEMSRISSIGPEGRVRYNGAESLLSIQKSKGAMTLSTDGGKTWKPMTGPSFQDAHLARSGPGFALSAEDGSIWKSTDGGSGWSRVKGKPPEGLRVIHFRDENRGFALGEGSSVHSTIDGGVNWRVAWSGPDLGLHTIDFVDGKVGWCAGSLGHTLVTTDGGRTWGDSTLPQQTGRAPWYYVALVGSFLLLVPALRRRDPVKGTKETITQMFVSDRPLRPGDPDPLEFEGLALGISRFIRNPSTDPPLTIAITGQWGSGKSSLMNLVRADLRSRGFSSIWFNAWHHQKEEQLLAALLESIRKEAVPPVWTPRGFRFRLQLLWGRCLENLVVTISMLLAGSASAGYVGRLALQGRLEEALTFLGASNGADPAGGAEGGSALVNLIASLGPIFAGVASLPPVYALLKAITAFGANPASLLATRSGASRQKQLEAQAGFRHRFQKEFRQVTNALRPRTLIILVDDLDRCRPQNVLDVLEAVNFLVSSGRCVVVMGMAKGRVLGCIGRAFEDVAEDFKDEDGEVAVVTTPLTDEGKRKARQMYAEQYLRKLVNIEVPVPVPNEEQREALATGEGPKHSQPALSERFAALAALGARAWAPRAAAVVTIILGALFGTTLVGPDGGEKPGAAVFSRAGGAQDEGLESPGEATKGGPEGGETDPAVDKRAEKREPAVVDPGREIEASGGISIWWAAILLVLGFLGLQNRPEVIPRDSKVFTEALAAWRPYWTTKRKTPRSIKRFVNELRFYAMRGRGRPRKPPPQSLKDRLRALWPWRPGPQEGTVEDGIPEDLLVAMGVVREIWPEWLDEAKEEDFGVFLETKLTPPGEKLSKEMLRAIASLKGKSIEPHMAAFGELAKSVRV